MPTDPTRRALARQPLVAIEQALARRALTTAEIVEATGLELLVVLQALHILRADVITTGSLCAGYAKRWKLPTPTPGRT